jgi:multiple sugar transport system substrate-binding protein
MRGRAVVLAAAIVMAPLGARAADLVVWWEEGIYSQEDEAVREVVAVFEQDTSKQVELAFYSQRELGPQIEAALKFGQPPDFAFGTLLMDYIGE